MHYDQYGCPVYNSADIFELIYQKKDNLIKDLVVEIDQDLSQFEELSGINLTRYSSSNQTLTDFDNTLQDQWFMPDEYKMFDIEYFVLSKCPNIESHQSRVLDELTEFKKRDLLNLLRWLKYFVDYSTDNGILWGVGRGSSVASYVLFLIGVHDIDSIKYNLDWQEFLR